MMLSEIRQTPKTNATGFLFYLEFAFSSKAGEKNAVPWGNRKDNQGKTKRRKAIEDEGVNLTKVYRIHR